MEASIDFWSSKYSVSSRRLASCRWASVSREVIRPGRAAGFSLPAGAESGAWAPGAPTGPMARLRSGSCRWVTALRSLASKRSTRSRVAWTWATFSWTSRTCDLSWAFSSFSPRFSEDAERSVK